MFRLVFRKIALVLAVLFCFSPFVACNSSNCPHENCSEVEREATCKQMGEIVITCLDCGEVWRERTHVNPDNHGEENIEILPAVEPTYDNDGLTEGKRCKVCGKTILPQYRVPKKTHELPPMPIG